MVLDVNCRSDQSGIGNDLPSYADVATLAASISDKMNTKYAVRQLAVNCPDDNLKQKWILMTMVSLEFNVNGIKLKNFLSPGFLLQ